MTGSSPRSAAKARQQGMISVVAVIFLITAVIFVLSQTLAITGVTSGDNKVQLDGVRAFFAAESGAEQAEKILTTGSCAALSAGVSGSLDNGAGYGVLIDGAESCVINQGATICTCGFISTGTAGAASRRVRLTAQQRSSHGLSGGGTTVTKAFTLKNSHSVPAIAIFNSAVSPLKTGASITISSCTYDNGAACGANYLQWRTESSNTSETIDDMGVALSIAADGNRTVTYGFNETGNWAVVGGLLPGINAGSPPKLLSSYWKDNSGNSTSTTYGSPMIPLSTGLALNGAAFSNETCIAGGSKQEQTCNSWCAGGDTLVFGVGAKSESASNISAASFNTGNTAAPLPMNALVSYPNEPSPNTPTGGGVYSSVFYLFNPNFAQVAANQLVPETYYMITSTGTTNFTTVGAGNSNVGTIFKASGPSLDDSGKAMPLTANYASVYKGRGTAAVGAEWKSRAKSTACSISVDSATFAVSGSGDDCIDTPNKATGPISPSRSDVVASTTNGVMTVSGSVAVATPIYPGARITPGGGASEFRVVRQLSGIAYGRGSYEVSTTATIAAGSGWNVTNYLLWVSPNSNFNYPRQQLSAGLAGIPAVAGFTQSYVADTADVISVQPKNKPVVSAAVAAQLASAESDGKLGGAGVYSLVHGAALSTVATADNQDWFATSNVLNVSDCVLCLFQSGETVSGLIANKTIDRQLTDYTQHRNEYANGKGRYVLRSTGAPSLPARFALADSLRVGTLDTSTVYLPDTSPALAVGQRFAVWSTLAGQFAGVVTSSGSAGGNVVFYTVDASKTPLSAVVDLVSLCVGTCALFDAPAAANSNTAFSVSSTNTTRWAGGFVCVRGVDGNNISRIIQPGAYSRKSWSELVQ